MATINNTIVLQDRLTPVLNKIMAAMSNTLSVMEQLNASTNNTNVGNAINHMRGSIQSAEVEFLRFNSHMNQTPTNIGVTEAFNQAEQSINKATGAINHFHNNLNQTSSSTIINNNFNQVEQRINDANSALDHFQSNLGQMPSSSNAHNTFNQVEKSINDANSALDHFQSNLNQTSSGTIINNIFNGVGQNINGANNALNQFHNNLTQTPTLAQRVRNAFSGIGQGIVVANQALQLFAQGFNFVNQQAEIADNFVLTKARIENMSVPLQQVDGYMKKIKVAANETRASFSDTAAAVAKLGTTAGQSFQDASGAINHDEILRFSQLMNKSFAVGGAGIQEQTSGMYQLTQAMAAGKLQGDEFRSITENAPLLAKAIADYTGKSIGDLKKMSSEGQITANIIKSALFASAEELEEKYKNLPMTWAGYLLKNSW